MGFSSQVYWSRVPLPSPLHLVVSTKSSDYPYSLRQDCHSPEKYHPLDMKIHWLCSQEVLIRQYSSGNSGLRVKDWITLSGQHREGTSLFGAIHCLTVPVSSSHWTPLGWEIKRMVPVSLRGKLYTRSPALQVGSLPTETPGQPL